MACHIRPLCKSLSDLWTPFQSLQSVGQLLKQSMPRSLYRFQRILRLHGPLAFQSARSLVCDYLLVHEVSARPLKFTTFLESDTLLMGL